MRRGAWTITGEALADYGRIVSDAEPSRQDLVLEIERAKFVKDMGDGSELWRGGKPLRLRFIVRAAPEGALLVRIKPESDRAAPRARSVRLWDGDRARFVTLEVTREVRELVAGERLVAWRLATGEWVTAAAMRTRPDGYVGFSGFLMNEPDWVRQLRGRSGRRGGRGGETGVKR